MSREYLDADYWRELAAKHGLRMPRTDTKGWPAQRLMARYGVEQDEFSAVFACSPTVWRRLNPDWTLFGFAGLLLEIVENRPTNGTLGERPL